MRSTNRNSSLIAAGYFVCLAAIGVLLKIDIDRAGRVEAIERRLSMERTLHENEWQVQQAELAASRERERRLQAAIDAFDTRKQVRR